MKRSSRRYPQIFLAAALSAALLLSGCGRAGAGGAEDAATGMEAGLNAEQATEPSGTAEAGQPDTMTETTGEDGSAEASDASETARPETEASAQPDVEDLLAEIRTAENGAGVSIHDPSIEVFDGRYYLFGSHMTGAYSDDLQTWTYIGNGYSPANPLFENLFADGLGIFDYAGDYGDGTYAVWAEDVIYLEEMEKYVMYFCVSSTYIKSNLCYATADAPEGPYVYQGPLLYSGFTAQDIGETDVYEYVDQTEAFSYLNGGQYNNSLWPNCIDPAPFFDAEGRLWMVYGSWSGGIFLLELDPATGLVIHPEADPENDVDPYFGKRLLGGGHISIEGPYIQYDEKSGYYYLYVSYGGLERTGGYQIRVFRSRTPDGEYVDMNGEAPSIASVHAKYGLKLSGNYEMPGCKYAHMATGGQSAFQDEDGKQYLCYHSRFDHGTEYHEPCVKQVFVNEEGWPVLAPYTTKGETLSETGYGMEEMAGTYFFINQGIGISDEIAEPVLVTLNKDGTVSGSVEGTWESTEGTAYMKLSCDGVTYSGVFCRMQDEAGTEVMTFSAAGNNQSVWGARYPE